MRDGKDAISATIQYATSLFKRETIKRFAAHYENVLTDMVIYQ